MNSVRWVGLAKRNPDDPLQGPRLAGSRQFVIDHADEVFQRLGADEHSAVDEKTRAWL
jgi:hypothetical protein